MMWNTYVRYEYYGQGIENFAISIYASENTYVDYGQLAGLVFIQDDDEGLASLHFEEEPYISYRSAPSDWTLDNGSAFPDKKHFVNTRWTASDRTFYGEIHWDPIWNGVARWEFTLIFSQDFSYIEGGQVYSYDASGSFMEEGTWLFGMDQSFVYLISEDSRAVLEAYGNDCNTYRGTKATTVAEDACVGWNSYN
jgi:hypothetical protein